jgi:hypothetical protein
LNAAEDFVHFADLFDRFEIDRCVEEGHFVDRGFHDDLRFACM